MNTPNQNKPERIARIHVMRHGRYDRSIGNQTSGHLTQEGIKEIKEILDEKLAKVDLQHSKFVVVGSSTYWMDNPNFGRRAIETANVIKECIMAKSREHGIKQNTILKQKQTRYTRRQDPPIGQIANKTGKLNLNRLSKTTLSEPNLYSRAPNTLSSWAEEYGGRKDNFWNRMARSEEPKEESNKAETPSVIKKKMSKGLKDVIEWAKAYSDENGVSVETFLVTHGEVIKMLLSGTKYEPEGSIDYCKGFVLELGSDGSIEFVPEYSMKYLSIYGPPEKPDPIEVDRINIDDITR